jgi:hypothetical protein
MRLTFIEVEQYFIPFALRLGLSADFGLPFQDEGPRLYGGEDIALPPDTVID